jgi:adenylosuccinate lyase
VLSQNPAHTAGQQWLERTLDDSANRRLSISEGFLAADAILDLLLNVTGGLEVRGAVIARHALQQLPFIASEEILMAAVKRGGDRQLLHEVIRGLAIESQARVKETGAENDFLERARRHSLLADAVRGIEGDLVPERYVGLAAQQVEAFIRDAVDPILARHADAPATDEVRV